jgi:hypothetical protein
MEQESLFIGVLQATRSSRVDDKGAMFLLDAQGKPLTRLVPITP